MFAKPLAVAETDDDDLKDDILANALPLPVGVVIRRSGQSEAEYKKPKI